MTATTRTLREVVGRNVRARRDNHRITADELAGELRAYGLKWNINRVSELERGQKAVGIPELVTLGLALSSLTGETVTPGALLDTADPIELNSEVSLQNNALRRLIEGRYSEGPQGGDLELGDVPGAVEELQARVNQSVEWMRGMPEGITFGQIDQAFQARTLTDRRAAKKLGLTDAEFMRRCLTQWGHMLSVETEQRAGPEANAQKRGRITRELINELKKVE